MSSNVVWPGPRVPPIVRRRDVRDTVAGRRFELPQLCVGRVVLQVEALARVVTAARQVEYVDGVDRFRRGKRHRQAVFEQVGVERGIVQVVEEIEIVGIKDTNKTTVTGVEMFRKLLDEGRAGDNIGALLRGVKREEIERGQVLAAPGSITPHTKFKAECYILTKEEGGRHTPFFNGYRPQFYFRTTDVTGVVTLPEGVEMVMPGDNVTIEGVLITPIAMEKELRFAIREGGRTVGAGVVSEIIE